MILHGSAIQFQNRGALILGASGSGKSALALQLMAFGATLVADDRVDLEVRDTHLYAQPPAAIRGLIEARSIGILSAEYTADVRIDVVIQLDQVETRRCPDPHQTEILGVLLPCIHKFEGPAFPAAILQYLKGGLAGV